MLRSRRFYALFSSVLVLLIASAVGLISQSTGHRSPAQIHEQIDENKLVTLHGNTRS